MEKNEAIENIMTRSSVRSYLDKPVEKEKIITLLKAGMAAPSAGDKRPWHFVVIIDKEQLTAITKTTPYVSFAAKAPLAIVVCGNTDKAFCGDDRDMWIQDTSAASENILLAAHALGLGGVWAGVYPVKDRVEAVSRVLELPDNIIPLNILVIGYPKSAGHVKDKWNEDNVSWEKFMGKKG